MSNSPIFKYRVAGACGPDGSRGATGNRGNTGNTGSTGSTGAYGKYYSSFTYNGNNILLTYSDGTTAELVGNFRGATYADQTTGLVEGSNTGPNAVRGLLYNVNGGTFSMKGICAYGSLRASVTGPNNEYISIDTIYWGQDLIGNYDPSTMTPGRFLYLGTPTVVYGAGITHTPLTAGGLVRGISGAFNFEISGTYASSNHLNAGSKIQAIGPIKQGALVGYTGGNIGSGAGTTTGIFLDADSAGTFVLHTPIGIRGISGSFSANEIVSITILIDSDDVWTFPQNIYFEPDENYLSCGKNIIGLMSYDGGNTWIATPAHRGHGVENVFRQCIPGYLFGSCCYENGDGTLECKDYSTRTECDKLFGTFNAALPCEASCGTKIGICCSGKGDCIEGLSVNLCDKFGGTFWEGVTCDDYNPTGLNYDVVLDNGRFCYDPCSTVKAVCCKNGQCLGNYTRIQCETILGGRSLTAASCEEADCCDHSTVAGACCKCTTSGYECLGQLTPTACKGQGGFYMGPGKQCNEVSCGCVCGRDATCVPTTCPSGQIFDVTTCSCIPDGSGSGPANGICCKNGTCLPGVTNKVACDAQCGAWLSTVEVVDLLHDVPGADTTYQFGSNPNDCEFCAKMKPVFSAFDYCSCMPSVAIEGHQMHSQPSCINTPIAGLLTCASFKMDIFFNLFDLPIVYVGSYDGPNKTRRELLLELLSCPTDLSENAANSYIYMANQLLLKLSDDYNFSPHTSCPAKCCTCSGPFGSSPVCNIPYGGDPADGLFTNLCTAVYCPDGSSPSTGDPCGGPQQTGGGGGTTPTACFTGASWCSQYPGFVCDCTPSTFTNNTLTNVRVYINSTEWICVPVACGDCVGYELCEVT